VCGGCTGELEELDESAAEEAKAKEEESAAQFREMLIELGVAPFSKWDKELPKICVDPRCAAAPEYPLYTFSMHACCKAV